VKINLKPDKYFKLLSAVFLFALVLRLIYFLQIKNDFWFNTPFVDDEIYHEWAVRILHGEWLWKNVPFMNPGYPYFLSMVYLVFGQKLVWPVLIQYVIGAANCLLIYFIAKKTFNGTVGIIAAFLNSIYLVSFFYESRLLTAVLINFFNLLALLLIIRSLERKTSGGWLGAGVLFGLCTMLRPTVLLFVPFLFAGFFLILRRDIKRLLTNFLLLALGLAVIIFPVTLRNYLISGKFILTTSNMGVVFFMGNNPEATGTFSAPDFCRLGPMAQEEDFKNEAEKRLNKKLNSQEVSRYWLGQSLRFMKSHPGRYLALLWKKFCYFWNSSEIPSNFDFTVLKQFVTLRGIPLLSFGMIAPLGMLGFIYASRKNRGVFLLDIYFFSYLLNNLIFLVSSEYRFPIVPVLMIFSACFICRVPEIMRQVNYRSILVIPLGAAFVLFTNINLPTTSKQITYCNLGLVLSNRGEYDRSIEMCEKALRLEPASPEAHNIIGCDYARKKMYGPAEKELGTALKLAPDNKSIEKNLLDVTAYEKQIAPVFEQACGRGLYFMNKGMYDNAIGEFQKAAALREDRADLYNILGVAYIGKKDYNTAVNMFKKALEIDPSFEKARYNLNLAITDANKQR
jgi:tetratricopeptide (TPR) repeat protein